MSIPKTLLIFSTQITPRINYTFKLIFTEILGLDIRLTDNIEEFKSYEGPKLNYSKQSIGDELFFFSVNLLFQTGIEKQDINVFDWENCKVFYQTENNSIVPFDPFAATFYLAVRYEEYLPHKKDKFGRFEADKSLAYQNGFLQKPVINIWAKKIKDIIKQKYPDYPFPQRSYQYISTIDIDHAYAYLEKGFLRTFGAYARSLVHLDFNQIVERSKVLLKKLKDPYDTYEFQFSIQQKYNLEAVYFFLVSDYSKYDKNVPINSTKFKALIQSIAEYGAIGIHPSFTSNNNGLKLEKEINRLSKVLNKPITKSRQHYLVLNLPDTYRNLIKFGITDDYTMGYASEPGFRAGICTPFWFYDLKSEKETNLKLHPFAVMDGTLKDYKKLTAENAISCIHTLIKEVKAVDGTFISLWHNHSLSNAGEWIGWRDVYEQMIEQ
ncbi:MAG: hypothetical protein FVQ77_11120 [Cytophagales bacterium]|nr:hypothetical protein [Cytophagales bacterium]